MWQPLTEVEPNPRLRDPALTEGTDGLRVFQNDRYQIVARTHGDMTWLSIKRHDRGTEIPWRHFQQIKNEVCGDECEAVQLYPAESRLADTANEYHLWVLPAGMPVPLGFSKGMVSTNEQAAAFTADQSHLGRQAQWEDGLTTGSSPTTPVMSDEEVAETTTTVKRITDPKPPADATPDDRKAAREIADMFGSGGL